MAATVVNFSLVAAVLFPAIIAVEAVLLLLLLVVEPRRSVDDDDTRLFLDDISRDDDLCFWNRRIPPPPFVELEAGAEEADIFLLPYSLSVLTFFFSHLFVGS